MILRRSGNAGLDPVLRRNSLDPFSVVSGSERFRFMTFQTLLSHKIGADFSGGQCPAPCKSHLSPIHGILLFGGPAAATMIPFSRRSLLHNPGQNLHRKKVRKKKAVSGPHCFTCEPERAHLLGGATPLRPSKSNLRRARQGEVFAECPSRNRNWTPAQFPDRFRLGRDSQDQVESPALRAGEGKGLGGDVSRHRRDTSDPVD